MKLFLLGCLTGFVLTIIIFYLYSCLVVGGDKDE